MILLDHAIQGSFFCKIVRDKDQLQSVLQPSQDLSFLRISLDSSPGYAPNGVGTLRKYIQSAPKALLRIPIQKNPCLDVPIRVEINY